MAKTTTKKKAVKGKRKMRRGGGKAKGASFERHIAKVLSLWITNGKHEDTLWRSAMSGGRATVQNRKGKKITVRQAGDICSVAPEGHALTDEFYLELKHVKKLALDQFIIKGTGPLANFWKIAKREAKKHKKQPVIIARQNGWPDLVIAYGGDFNNELTQIAICGDVHISLLSEILKTDFHNPYRNKE